MVVKEEFLSRLRKIFGLNLYEVKVWTALLSRGISTAGELADISGVPRSRTYDILESLEKKGFIVMKLGKPIKFIALKPEEVVERVKKNVIREAHEMAKRLDELKGSDVLEELTKLYTTGIKYVEPTDLSGAIRGRHNIYNHLDMMIRNATKTVTIATSAESLLGKFEALRSAIEKARKKGVQIRIAVPITPKNYEVAKQLSKIAEVRSGNIRSRFAMVDGKELMFLLLDDKEVHPNYDVGVWINSPILANTIEQLFAASWEKMTPLNKVKLS